MANLVNKKCVKCFYCGGKAYSYAMMNYKGFKFNGHPSCKQKWMKNVDAIKQSDALGTVRGKRKGTYIEVEPELPFTPEEDFDDLQVVIHESLAPTAISESTRIAELEGELQAVRSLNFGLREHNDELWKIIRALTP